MLKNGKTGFGCLCFILFISLVTFQLRAEKRVLIGTSGEHLDKRWNSIHSKQDGEIIREALIKGQHFSENNITVVDGEKATKANVAAAFKTLINETRQGDIVIFFFSGHGQHVTDISGDEVDGWDEALVLSRVLYENLSKMDYATFFEIIKARKYKLGKEYVLCETPQIEGNINRLMFAGKAIDIPKHFTINRMMISADSKTLVINAGELAGLTKGTELSFYPVMTSDIKNTSPIYTCKIDTGSLLESVVKVPSSIKIDAESWAFVSKYMFPSEKKKEYIASKLREAWTSDKSISLEIIPVSHSANKKKQAFSQNNIEFVYSDTFEIKVTNTSKYSFYFLLVNILPDNKIKTFYFRSPDNDNRNDNHIEPGESKTGKRFKVGEGSPPGLETLMVIAADKPADLSSIESRAGNDIFEDILDIILDADRSQYTIQNISIDKKNYIIKPK